jgi:hypothetical protein
MTNFIKISLMVYDRRKRPFMVLCKVGFVTDQYDKSKQLANVTQKGLPLNLTKI